MHRDPDWLFTNRSFLPEAGFRRGVGTRKSDPAYGGLKAARVVLGGESMCLPLKRRPLRRSDCRGSPLPVLSVISSSGIL